MENLKPYMKYKSADLLWIDSIPEHWEICKNKNVMTLKKDIVGNKSSEYTLLSLTKRGIIPRDLENAKGKFPKEFNTYQVINENDIVFCLFDIDETPRTVGISLVEGMITGAYTVFRAKNINEKYLHYYYFSLDNHKKLKPLYTGLRKVINTDAFLKEKMFIPPIEEQNQIVKYVDFKISKIEKFIDIKKQLIEKLEEQKKIIINNAITKGLNPDSKMKPSGIEWFDNMPKEWSKDKLTRLFEIIGSGTTPQSGIDTFYNGSYSWINSGDLNDGILYATNKKITQKALDKYSALKMYPKDVFYIALYGATIGKLAISKIEACCNQACCVLGNMDKRLLQKYVFYVLLACRNHLIEQGKGGGQPNINQDIIRKTWIPIPSLEEQHIISDYIDVKIKCIDTVITATQKQIDLIGEYCIRLISDIVTGKFDVRDIEINDTKLETKETNMFKKDDKNIVPTFLKQDCLTNNKTTVFLSYCHIDFSLADLVEKNLKVLTEANVKISRDERGVDYRGSFKAFMDTIGHHDYVIAIISEHYLKSKNCMYEALEVFKNPDYKHKLIFIIVNEKDKVHYKPIPDVNVGADVYTFKGGMKYIKHWKDCIDEIEALIKEIEDSSLTINESKELQLMKKIRAELSDIFNYLRDRKGVSITDLINSGFNEIISIINKQ